MPHNNKIEDDSLFYELEAVYSKLEFINLERYLEIKEGTLKDILSKDNDWSMIIKIGVFIEAALERLLTVAANQVPLDFIKKLNISGRTGKIQLASSLELIDTPTKKRIEALMQIRNNFAHKLEYINHSLSEYYVKINDKTEHWNDLFSTQNRSSQKSTNKTKIQQNKKIEINEKSLKMLYWCAGILALKSLSDAIIFNVKKSHIQDLDLLTAYISKDYSREKYEKYREIGKEILEKLDNHPNELIEIHSNNRGS